MRSNMFRRAAICAAFALLICSIAVAQSASPLAQPKAHDGLNLNPKVVIAFENDWNPHFWLPLGITAGPDGNLYAAVTDYTFSYTCEIVRFTPDGKRQDAFLNIPTGTCLGMMLGLAFDERDRLHLAFYGWMPGTNGVYWVKDDGTMTQVLELPGPDYTFPFGLAFHDEDMYVSDSYQGAIWKKGPHDPIAATEPWFKDTNLLSPGGFGAHGIAFYKDALYVAVSWAGKDASGNDTGSIVRIPIERDGSPGVPEYASAPDPRLNGVGGLAFDVTGKLWFVTTVGTDGMGGKLGTLDKDGTLQILADDPGWLDAPHQLVFGTTPRTKELIYVMNIGTSYWGNPGVVSVDAGIPGLRLPADH